jgi:hypothetical protein
LYQGVLGWFCGLASELELAHLGAVHPANSPMAGPQAPVPVTRRSTSPYRRSLHTTQERVLEHFLMVGYGKGSQFMHLLRNAPHSPSQISPLPRLSL